MRKNSVVFLGLVGICLSAVELGTARAGVIYTEDFSGAAGTLLGGKTPTLATGADGGSAAATWTADTTAVSPISGTASAAVWTLNGSGSATVSTAASDAATSHADSNIIANAELPFVPVAGTKYTLTATLAPSYGDATSGNWLGIGFAQANFNGHTPSGTASALSNDTPFGLLILKGSGLYQTFAGVGTGNAGPTATLGTGGPHTVSLILDTTATAWTMSWSVDGGAASTPFTYATNPSIGVIAFGSNKIAGGVSNLSLVSSTVPEPAAAAGVVAAGVLGVMRRRR